MLTDNPVLLRKHRVLPTLCCAQKSATKCVPADEDFIKANIDSFGNEVGMITNRVTSMYEVAARFDEDSVENKTLQYRIRCGQLYQQDCIDKAKGIISAPMPRYWHDKKAVSSDMPDEQRELCRAIVADRKPYFMRYIYPSLMRDYNAYIKTTTRNALREFGKTVDELLAQPADSLTEREAEFLRYYHHGMPVGMGDCVMNRICRRFEAEFDGYLSKTESYSGFVGAHMRSSAEYTRSQYNAIKGIVADYNSKLKRYKQFATYERVDEDEFLDGLSVIDDEFTSSCAKVCTNADVLCNIILDLSDTNAIGKRFVWKIAGETVIKNLLAHSGGIINYPAQDASGEVEYGGMTFAMKTACITEMGDEDDYSE